MAQDVEPWRTPQMISSLEQKSEIAKSVLAQSTTSTEATKAAKQLVGSYAHMKPGDPDVFVASVAAVLSQYPLGLVRECCDPRTGVARTAKFLSVAELVEWLDDRLKHHQALASHKPRPPALPAPVYSEEHKATMRKRFADLIASIFAHSVDPVDKLKRAARQQPAREAAE